MSSVVYGTLARRRELAGTRHQAVPARWIDIVAAVVPAEALAIQVAVVDLATTTTRDFNGNVVTAISDPGLLRIAFVVLFLLSGVLYAAAHLRLGSPPRWHTADSVRVLLPPFAFLTWTLAMKASVIDAVLPEVTDTVRNSVALVLAVILVALAFLLSGSGERVRRAAAGDRG